MIDRGMEATTQSTSGRRDQIYRFGVTCVMTTASQGKAEDPSIVGRVHRSANTSLCRGRGLSHQTIQAGTEIIQYAGGA